MNKCPDCGTKFDEKLIRCPNCGKDAASTIQNYDPNDPGNIKKSKRDSLLNILGKTLYVLLISCLSLFFIVLTAWRSSDYNGYARMLNGFFSKFNWLIPWTAPILGVILLGLLVSFTIKLKKNGYLNFRNKFDKNYVEEVSSVKLAERPIQTFNPEDPLTDEKLQKAAFLDSVLRIIGIFLYVGIVVLVYFIFRNTIISDSSYSPSQASALLAVLDEWSLRIGLIMGLLLFAILLGWKKKK